LFYGWTPACSGVRPSICPPGLSCFILNDQEDSTLSARASRAYGERNNQNAETYLSTQQPTPRENAWIPHQNVHQERTGRTGSPPRARQEEAHRQRREVTGTPEFPKSARILRSKDFRRVYDDGAKFSGPLFSAFCLRNTKEGGARVGFTCTRAMGGSVIRNRVKRRVREAVRVRMDQVAAGWEIVINPRLRAMTVPFPQLEKEVERLFQRCAN